MDLTKLSTSDLEALRDGDLSRVSTQGLKMLKESAGAMSQPEKAAEAPSFLSQLGRQAALTARHGLEGVGQVLDLGGAPIAAALNKATSPGKFDAPSTSMTKIADAIGLPKPENANERIAASATKLMAGTATGIGGARLLQSAPGITGELAKQLASQPVNQLTAAAGSGVAGQTAKETGQNPFWEFGAATLGSVAGGLAPNVAASAGNKLSALLPASKQQVDVRLQSILGESGVDFSKLPNPVKQGIRDEVTKALQTGGNLNPDAVRRLADIKMVGGTPTKGMLSLDPVQITREKNLSKIAANMNDDTLKGLPLIENENNNALIRTMNKVAGGDADLYAAGERTLSSIRSRDQAARTVEAGLYEKARNSAGRDVPLDRSYFGNRVDELLNDSNKGAFLPSEIRTLVNDITLGQKTLGHHGPVVDVPFNVNTIDQLKTILATAQRGAKDGNVRSALGIVRQALEETPITVTGKPQFGGGQVVNGATAEAMQAADSLPESALNAFNRARQFARARRAWQESSPGVSAAIDGAEPDKFIERFVLKGNVSDAEGVIRELKRSPEALDATRQAVVNYLKKQSLSGASDEVGKFSQSAYNKALSAIGDRKLSMLFDANEIGQLKAAGRAASYMQVQPVGSAVNNSNSGALVLGKIGDATETLMRALPLGQSLADFSKGARLAISTRNVKDVPNALLTQQPQNALVPRGLLPATVYGGGLFTIPPGLNRPEDR